MAAVPLTSMALSLSVGYYVIPRMYYLTLKTIATYHIVSMVVGFLATVVVKNTFETEKFKDHFYQRHFVELAIVTSAAYIAWHATSLTNDPMPANAALLICCFDSLLILVSGAIVKIFSLQLPNIWEPSRPN